MNRDLYVDLLGVANAEMESGKTVQEATDSALKRNLPPQLSVAHREALRKQLIADLNKGKNLPGGRRDRA
jgi:hypothetical protein